jgi:hypothetical protein
MCLCSKTRFTVTASRSVGRKIRKGEKLLVDGDAQPRKGCYVVTAAGRLEPWKGQAFIYGVAICVERSL